MTRCQPFRDRAAAITRELRQDAQTQVNDVILLDLKRMRILLIEHSGRHVSARHKCAWLKTKALCECTLCKHGILWSPYTDWFSDPDGLAFLRVSFLKGFFPPVGHPFMLLINMLFLHSNSMSTILGARMSDRKSSGESKTQHLEVKTCHGRYMHFITSSVCCSLEAKVLLYFREIFSGDLRVWSHFHAEGCCWCKCPRGCNSRLGGEIWAF